MFSNRENKFSSLNFIRTKKEGNKVNLDKYDGSEETNKLLARISKTPPCCQVNSESVLLFPQSETQGHLINCPRHGFRDRHSADRDLDFGNVEFPPLRFQNNFLIWHIYENKNGLNTVEGLNNREN